MKWLVLLLSVLCAQAQQPFIMGMMSQQKVLSVSRWSPTNAFVWYHADSITASDGSAVSNWSDSSGGGHDAWVYGANNQYAPYFSNSVVNGKPSLIWTNPAANRIALTNSFGSALAQPFTLMFVINAGARNGSFPYLFDGIDTTRCYTYRDSGTPWVYVTAAGNTINSPSAPPSGYHILTVFFNGTSSYIRTNGVLLLSGNPGTASVNGFTLGNKYDTSTDRSMNGGISEIIIYKGAMATNDLQWAENALGTNYNIKTPGNP